MQLQKFSEHSSEHDTNTDTISIIIGKSFLKMLKNYIPSSNWSSLDGKLCCLHQISQPVIASSRYPLDVSDANQYSSVEKHQIKKINTQAYSWKQVNQEIDEKKLVYEKYQE